MTDAELEAWEASRDLEAELLASVAEMAAGKTAVAYSPVVEVRKASGLSQAQFAQLLGVSVRTLQGWEQGRRRPTGAARTLILLARQRPEVLREAMALQTRNDEAFELAA